MFHLDGEGVVCDEDGVAAFYKLHSKANDHAVFLYAFDLLEIDGEDLTPIPLEERKARLRKVQARRKGGIVYNEHLDGDGATIFHAMIKNDTTEWNIALRRATAHKARVDDRTGLRTAVERDVDA